MQFLSLYTPATAPSGPPDAAHMEQMGRYMEESMKSGILVMAGGLLSRNTGMKVVQKNGTYTVEHGPVEGSSLMPAAGFAILRAESREQLEGFIKQFLALAGDGTCEIIQMMDGPPPAT